MSPPPERRPISIGVFLFQEGPGDDNPLDLRGSFVDLRDLGVAEVPLDQVFLHVAVPSMDLYRIQGGLNGAGILAVDQCDYVTGRALLEQDRTDAALMAFVDAEQLFQRLGLQSQLAAAWTAQADAWLRRDESRRAALLYRRAVEAIQDFHF